MGNIIACATDGAPSMIGRHRGFIAHLKRAVLKVFSIHRVIHRQHLIAKHLTLNLHQSLQIVNTATNKKNSLMIASFSNFVKTMMKTINASFSILNEDLLIRFKDLTKLVILNCVINPFRTNIETLDPQFQEEFIDLQNDIECNAIYTQCGYSAFWMKKKVSERYPHIFQTVKLMSVAFPSSYLVEKGFSTVVNLLTKQSNRLEIATRGDLRLDLT
ncbi:Protein ZBED8 [Oopsacas minuta]|uniref:Protein ZBED8 n=1 Tax=Oopsacas minuta TaxID=111878 RepID=A0AAV7K5I5_9METZ|nr:Protein ZBED8 [Oopsacas minuta]